MMGNLDREQLEALKRQIEEDYKLDMAAIERLQKRFIGSTPGVAAVKEVAVAERAVGDRNLTVLPTLENQSEAQPDDLTNTLRGMFSTHRR